MSLLDLASPAGLKNELDLFSLPPTDTSILDGAWVDFHSLNEPNSGPIEFFIHGSGSNYYDLGNAFLYVRLKISHNDDKPLTQADDVALINNSLHSLFSNIEMYLNDTLITNPSTNSYAYSTYLTKFLNYSSEVRKSVGSAFGLMSNYADRKTYTGIGNPYELMDRLDLPFCNQEKVLLNGVNIRLRLNRTNDQFALTTATADNKTIYKITIDEAKLKVRVLEIDPYTIEAHNKILANNVTAKYVIERPVIKSFLLSTGDTMRIEENLFASQIPSKILVCFPTAASFNGSLTTNPYNFSHHNISHLGLYVNNLQSPVKPYIMDFNNNKYLEAYFLTLANLGYVQETTDGIELTRGLFKTSACIFCFNLAPDLRNGDHLNLIRQGNVRLEVQFSAALTEPINLLVLGSYQSLIEISKDRIVTHDF